ncbi:MAG: MerC domain-containing protein [Asticcacaulis sp.]|uniref:MerC domain-containing protein n=1 Tax=Asticcacaulis sp. TaxID=1872648 RepID=UPI0039E7134C
MPDLKKKWLDIASLALSALCVVHCLALPFLVVLLPALTPFTGSWVHAALVLTAAPISLWAIRASHVWRKWQISLPIVAGLILLAAAAFIPALNDIEVAMSVIGALLIAAGHTCNYLYHRPAHVHDRTCGHAEGFTGE